MKTFLEQTIFDADTITSLLLEGDQGNEWVELGPKADPKLYADGLSYTHIIPVNSYMTETFRVFVPYSRIVRVAVEK
jgi:hypothetical protein